MAKKKPVPPRVRNMGVQPRPPGFVGPMPAEPARPARGPGGRLRQGIANQYPDPIGPSLPEPPVVAKAARGLGKLRKFGLAAAGIGAGLAGVGKLVGDYREQMIRKALLDIQKGQDDLRQRDLIRQAQASSYEDAIQRNLQSLSQSAPDLYASVAAGRKLPQGGVVIGGAPRQDLLNELGRAMADGRFSR